MRRLLDQRSASFFCILSTLTKRSFSILLIIAMTAISFSAVAWNGNAKTITGRILTTDGTAISGATISIKGSSISVLSSNDGGFSIIVPDENTDPVLIISSVGYVRKEYELGGRTNIDINLEVDIRKLDGVVVIGYGKQNRKDVTGSIVTVSGSQIQERPVSTYEDALAGIAAGIDVAPRSARPGNVSEIRIRGIGTISGGRDPLYVVDGFPTDQITAGAINPGDIQSVDILKDASATAIYGSRGANGVILITTRSGKPGQSKVNVAIKTGFAQANRNDFYSVLNGPQYVEWYKEKAGFAGQPLPSWITNYDGKTSTNWQDAIYRKAPFGDYAVNVSGGSDKLTFMFSGSYLHQDDILLNGGFDKYSAIAKMDYKASKVVSIGINLAPNYTVQKLSAPEDDYSSLTGSAVLLPPIIPVYNADGTPSDPNSFGILNHPMVNPITIANNYQITNSNFFLLSNAYVKVNILDNLAFKSVIGANVSDYNYHLFQKNGMNGQALYPVTATEQNDTRVVNWLSENTFTYNTTINSVHKFDVLAGYVVQKVDQVNVGANASNYASNLAQTVNFGSTQSGYSGATGNSLISWLGRINYSYKDRYLLTATVRRDGSSRFGSNNYWGTFPSIGLGWNIANEKFLENSKFIDHAKIRATWGETGSNFIGDFSSRGSLNAVNSSFGTTPVIGFVNGDPGNPDLSWEKSDQTDIGLDLGLFNRFSLVFDYYHNNANGLLLNVNVPPSTGYGSNLQNIGAMKKWGYEITVNANIISNRDFSWDLGFNASHQLSEVTNLGPDGGPLYQFFHVLVTKVGGPLEQEQVLKQTGILTQKDIDNPAVAKKATGDQAGDYKFLDVNKDGLIDAFNGADGYLDGDNNPRWLYGFNTTVRYKNWRFSALFQGQQGAKMLDFVYQIMSLHGNNTNMDTYFYDGRYISEAEPGNGSTPRAGYNDQGAVSSWEIQKTDYLRVRNLTLSYSFPTSISRKAWMDGLKMYISVENLYTWKSYQGGNPQAVRNGFDTQVYGDHKTLSLNSVATAPIPQTFIFGLNFSF